MKACVKSTGEIIEVFQYGKYHFLEYIGEKTGRLFLAEELDLLDSYPDYWTRLEHTYAGMAMQGMLNNSYLAGEFRKDPNNGIKDMSNIITKAAIVYAHALVQKMKEEK